MPKNNNNALQFGFGDLLKKESEFFNFADESLMDGLWFWNINNEEDGGISNKLAQLLGYAPEMEQRAISVNFLSLVHIEDLESIQEVCENHITNKTKFPFDVEIRLKHLHGHTLWFNLRGNMVSEESKDGTCLMGLAYCIDKYKERERRQIAQKEYYKNVVKGANLGIWEGNLISGRVLCNDRWANMIGYTLAELEPLTYDTFLSLVHPDDVHLIDMSLENHVKEHGIYEVEFRMHHKMGHWVWVLSRGEITKHSAEGHAEIVSGFHYDITSRKTNEILLEKYMDLFERSSEAAKIGYWEVDLKENTIFWSKVNRQIHEVSEDYRPTLEAGLGFYLEGEHRDRLTGIVSESIQKPMEFDEQLQLRTQKGNLKWVRVIGVSEHSGNECVKLYGLIQDIDQIKKVQLEIRFREEQFRQTFNHSAGGMALIDTGNKLLMANKSLCDIFGYTEAELQRLDLEGVAHPDDLRLNRKFIADLFRGKHKNIKLEHRFIHKNGSVIWAIISMSAIHNDQGEILHFVTQVEDITERKKNEFLLLEHKNLLEQSHIIGKIGSWKINPNDMTVVWSDNLIKLLDVEEYQPHSLEFSLDNYVQEGDRKMMSDAFESAINEGISFDLEIEILTHTKNLKWMRMIGVPEFENGKCIRLSGLIQDIAESRRLQLELSLSEEIFRTTFEHAAIGMIVVDLNGNLQKANPKICEILGYGEKEILEKTVFDFMHPEDMESTRILLEKTIATKEGFKMEKRCQHSNGSYIWIYEAVAAVKNDAGELMHFVAQIQDISDKKQMTENLTEHNNRLINFAHIVSHNLRSHTSNISMLLDLAQQDDPDLIKNEYYRNVKLVSDNMNETIQQLSEIVEINSKVSSTLSSQNLLKIVKKAIKTVDPLVAKNKVKIELEVDGNIHVLAVQAYMESIILNLITNAIKYRSPDRQALLGITSGTTGDYAFLRFVDNGLGINLERYGSKLFGMYKTFHSHPEARGIGLFISKNQIEAMGGKIEVESEVNVGTTFTTYFRIV